MNILVVNMSAMPNPQKELEERVYRVRLNDCSVETITAKQTNESVLRAVLNLNAIKETGGIQKF